MSIGWILLLMSGGIMIYAFAGYPLLLRALSRRPPGTGEPSGASDELPMVSVTVPVFNEEAQIRETLDGLLALRYPKERLQILLVSDGSTDDTNAVLVEYESRGIESLLIPERGGKTKAEALAAPRLRGDLIVNTDASIRLHPESVMALVRAFEDPTVGVASGRDVSLGDDTNAGESGYVGLEMRLRALETALGGIVGASGCLYAIRRDLHHKPLPAGLSRDFASALVAIENGYRAVSVDDAVCYVPLTPSLKREFKRKIRTITRGMRTLWHKRRILNPVRYGRYAWMLWSHKVIRWLVPPAAVMGLLGLVLLSSRHTWAFALAGMAGVGLGIAAAGWLWGDREGLPRVLSIPAFALMANVAVLVSWARALLGRDDSVWEPTRRVQGAR